MSNSELEQLTRQLEDQNSVIDRLEKELSGLQLNAKNQPEDPNAQLLKKLTTENDKLKYRINILKQSIAEASGSPRLDTPLNTGNFI